MKIPVDKIGEVIGPKGKVINQIQDDTGADITIEDDGTIYVGADQADKAEAARVMINAIANPTMPEKGERYLGTVVKITAFGAFISLLPGKDGLLHISKMRPLAGGQRVESVEDVLERRPEDPGRDQRDRRSRQAVADSGGRGDGVGVAVGRDVCDTADACRSAQPCVADAVSQLDGAVRRTVLSERPADRL